MDDGEGGGARVSSLCRAGGERHCTQRHHACWRALVRTCLCAEEAGTVARRRGAVTRKVALAAALEAAKPRLFVVFVKVPAMAA